MMKLSYLNHDELMLSLYNEAMEVYYGTIKG